MQNKGTGGTSSRRGPQNTRVYAPTHRTGATPAAGAGQALEGRQTSRTPPNGTGARQPISQPASRQGIPPRQPAQTKPIKPFEQPERYAPTRSRQEGSQTSSRNTAYAPQRRQNAGTATQRGGHEPRQKAGSQAARTTPVRPKESTRKKDGQAGAISNIHRLESVTAAEEARKRELVREKKKEKKKQKQPVNPKKLLTYGVIGVSGIALLLLGYFLFLLQTVEVDGNGTYADESIIELSGLRKGTHMLLCNGSQVKENIEKNPYLQVRSVEKELPNTICIKVAERREVAAIRSQEYDVIIDDTGHVLSIGKGSDLTKLLLVSGMSNIGFEVNEQIGTASDLQTQALLSLILELEKLDLLKDVARADLSNPLNVCLYTTENITVMLGQPDGLSEKLSWMRDALPSLRKSGISGGTLDVSAKGGAIYAPAEASSLPEPQQTLEPASEPSETEQEGTLPPNETGTENTADPQENGQQAAEPPEESPGEGTQSAE